MAKVATAATMEWQQDEDGGERERQRIVITGAAGRIGSYFAHHHDSTRYVLRLMVRGDEDPETIDRIRATGDVQTGDLADINRLKELFAGADTVLHFAANANSSATWDSLLETNIVGTYNVFAAAKAAGCHRVVFASSIHAVSGYPADVQVKTSEPVNPGDLYGVSKCFGEAMARYMAEQEGVRAIAIRIGAFQPIEAARNEWSIAMMDAFVSHRDLNHLIERCIEAPDDLRFAIVHGLSDNHFKRLDLSDTCARLGYKPMDDLTDENPLLKGLRLSETVSTHSLQDKGQKSGIRKEI